MTAQSNEAVAEVLREYAAKGNYLRCEEIVRRALAFEDIGESLAVVAANLSNLNDHTAAYFDDDTRQLVELVKAADRIVAAGKELLNQE